ncbi:MULTISPECIES: Fur family transcriptional regulator [Enterococcus]|uniref:Fur family transcriptional regulator n=1 Tax=Enterococcus TaxID=1350 RepID=UPI00065DCEF1|nr:MULTISPECIES: transcriptional repressor [Enterococcus]KAF1304898.1 transcriptional repressor [Enterococcus sp. JM9B]
MAVQTLLDHAMTTLKKSGFKHTKKREAMITFLVKRNRYVSAREVHEHMTDLFPGLSYDTVYRNLHDFAEIDLLEETDLNGEMKFRFHCYQGHHHHHHFICTVCGKTKELTICPMDFFEEQLPGCKIEGHRFEILGRCEACQS